MVSARSFISHASRDATLAHELVAALEAGGVACWISGRDVAPGANYQEAIVGAIAGARAMVLLLTEAANASDEVKKELSLASAQGIPVYPVRVGAVQPNAALRYELATRQWIEAAAAEDIARHLVAAIGGIQAAGPAPSLPDKPSLAVLPFANLSGDAEQEWFVDGMTEEVITALSRVRSFFVIARNSSFTYKGRHVDIRQVARELGVRYVVEGSVRKAGDRLRIGAQLADGGTGAQIWSERFSGALDDVFALQEEVAYAIAGVLEPTLRKAEIARAERKPPGSLLAYDLVLRAVPRFWQFTPEGLAEAASLLRRAIEIDPHYALAYAYLSNCLWTPRQQGSPQWQRIASDDVMSLARAALRCDSDDPEVLALCAWTFSQAGDDLPGGQALAEKGVALNPNSIIALTSCGHLRALAGDAERALELLERAVRLSPLDDFGWRDYAIGLAHFVAGRYDRALGAADRVLRAMPAWLTAMRLKAAALGLLGRTDEARKVVSDMMAMSPDWTVAGVRMHNQYKMHRIPAAADALCEGLRRAGMPE